MRNPRAAYLLASLFALSCGGSPTSPANCINLAGTYNGAFNNSCGGSATNVPVVVAQQGCSFSATIPGIANVQGTINGSTATFTETFLTCMGGTATGTATVSSSAINGTFSGTSNGGAGCCPAGPISGSFTLTR
jgi:hypothetical protein